MKYLLIAIMVALTSVSSVVYASNQKAPEKHLFILSGQSNMKGLKPNKEFTPAVAKKFGETNVIVVWDAQSGQPIRRWDKNWKPAKGDEPKATGDLYDRLMTKVNDAIKGETITTVTFIWMQGETDAKERHGEVYADSLKRLIGQFKKDLKRQDINFVIGRLSDYDMADKKCRHWTMVRKAQVAVAEGDERGAWADTDDLNDGVNKKGKQVENDLHYTVEGYKLLGQRFAEKSIELIKNSVLLAEDVSPVHMANGIKIGEVSSTSAIIWTRLTKNAERNIDGTAFQKEIKRSTQSYDDLSMMEGAASGVAGEVRVTYWPVNNESQRKSTQWLPVDTDRDFIRQICLADLSAGTRYALLAEGRPKGTSASTCKVEGLFGTAPQPESHARVSFGVVTGQDYIRRDAPDGHKIYPVMQGLDLDFFVHTGDIEYYDRPEPYATSVELARFKWNRIYALPYQRSFHNVTASYFMKDDHETLKDDCWPGQTYGDLTFEQGLSLFREQVPMGEKTYRTVRWGKDLQIWLVEGRDFRSPNNMPDGPEKTIWGTEQKQWFFDTVKKSDATFRILISPTPIVGPDRANKNDNHANKGFTHEGNELRNFIGQQKNMFIVCGDRHWQYVSEDLETSVREYSCGPTSDRHAGGFSNGSPMLKYFKKKGGFLSVVIERNDGQAHAILTHYGVDGTIFNKDVMKAK